MNIAIVDDDKNDATQAKELVEKYLAGRLPAGVHANYECFASAESFLQHFEPRRYAFVILDIYMYELNGMQAAKKIVELDKSCSIIFLTSSTEHLLAGYTVHAAGYVLKPLSENKEQLCAAVNYCLEKLKVAHAMLTVHSDNVPIIVPWPELYYLDCQNNRFAVVHLASKSIKTTNTYQECLFQLQQDTRFLECYHRLLLNMDQIKAMREDTFLLKNDESVPISRRKKTEVKQAYLNYLSEP